MTVELASTEAEERMSRTDAAAAPSTIQPSGFLLALSGDWQVEGASANTGRFLGREPGELVGASASAFLADDTVHALRNRLALLREPDGIERLFACPLRADGEPHDIAIHVTGEQVIVEAEPSSTKPYGDVTGTLRGMMARLDGAEDLAALSAAGARQVRALTGFDRVIVTRFDDGGAAVIAESARGTSNSFVGTRIPASTLSDYERTAFRRSPLHVIDDVDGEAVAIVTVRPGDVPDLSRAVLRTASAGQIDYLRAIEARCSILIALEVGGAPWGMIACHHHAPRRTSFERRALVELFTQMLALRIEILELRSARAPA